MPFRLASLTKPLTATAVLMLVESGQLALDDTVQDLLPGYPAGGAAITLEHLLTHTSGTPEFTELPEWWAIHRQDTELDEVIDLFRGLPLAFAPGSRWAYSNSGYLLLGAIIEEVSGEGYADFLAGRVLAPLGMSSTTYDATSRCVIPGMVSGYSREPRAYVHPEYFSFTHFHAAGGLTSTVDDLARWYAALSSGSLLGAGALRRMWTPALLADGRSTRYGYGWWVGECRGHRAVEHYGSLPGYANYLLALPDDGILVVVVLSNDDGKLGQIERLAVEIAHAGPHRLPRHHFRRRSP
jgi:CubicO group peptidase (beta-lactamase class C family)